MKILKSLKKIFLTTFLGIEFIFISLNTMAVTFSDLEKNINQIKNIQIDVSEYGGDYLPLHEIVHQFLVGESINPNYTVLHMNDWIEWEKFENSKKDRIIVKIQNQDYAEAEVIVFIYKKGNHFEIPEEEMLFIDAHRKLLNYYQVMKKISRSWG